MNCEVPPSITCIHIICVRQFFWWFDDQEKFDKDMDSCCLHLQVCTIWGAYSTMYGVHQRFHFPFFLILTKFQLVQACTDYRTLSWMTHYQLFSTSWSTIARRETKHNLWLEAGAQCRRLSSQHVQHRHTPFTRGAPDIQQSLIFSSFCIIPTAEQDRQCLKVNWQF